MIAMSKSQQMKRLVGGVSRNLMQGGFYFPRIIRIYLFILKNLQSVTPWRCDGWGGKLTAITADNANSKGIGDTWGDGVNSIPCVRVNLIRSQ